MTQTSTASASRQHRDALVAIPPEQQQEMMVTPDGLRKLFAMRRRAYKEHLASMTLPDDVDTHLEAITGRHGAQFMVHHQPVPFDVLTTFMVIRYGEAVEHWPDALSPDDQRRLEEFASHPTLGTLPAHVRPYDPSEDE